jgi:hypothetical protein
MSVAALRTPWAATWILLTALGCVLFTDARRPLLRVLAGLVHTAAHVAAALALGWLGGQVGRACGLDWGSAPQVALGLGVQFLAGWFVSSLIFGVYLLVAVNLPGRHGNEAFSSLRIQDYKHFLRLHIRRDGALVLYPIGLLRVPRRWRTMVGAGPGEPKVIPDDPHPDTRPRLIEPPIVLGPG